MRYPQPGRSGPSPGNRARASGIPEIRPAAIPESIIRPGAPNGIDTPSSPPGFEGPTGTPGGGGGSGVSEDAGHQPVNAPSEHPGPDSDEHSGRSDGHVSSPENQHSGDGSRIYSLMNDGSHQTDFAPEQLLDNQRVSEALDKHGASKCDFG